MTKARSARTVIKGEPIQDEAAVAVGQTVRGGQLLERIAAGTVQPHSTADGTAQKMFARERDVFGKDRAEIVPAGDQSMFVIARSGDQIQARLATANTTVIGDALASAGTGALKLPAAPVAGTAPNIIVGFALEAITNVSGSDVDIIIEAA